MFKARTSVETVHRNSSTNDEESREITQNPAKLSFTDDTQQTGEKSGEKSGESREKSGEKSRESKCGGTMQRTSNNIGKRINQTKEKDEEPTLKREKWNTSLNVSL